MKKTIFKINKMDCPSEESIIKLKLGDFSDIKNLKFDLSKRTLIIYHTKSISKIEKSINELNLDSKIIKSINTKETEFEKNLTQKKALWIVLAINFSFFIIEIITGLISGSMGLIADSLDMLADSFVYAISLIAVGNSILKKKKVAMIAGYFQITLALIGFIEVMRRFIFNETTPDYKTMIIISLFALIANTFCLFILNNSKSKNEAHMKASLVFTSNDIIINIGVITAGIMVYLFNTNIPDLIVGFIVFIIVMKGALRILKISK